ncbi:MAG: hypothetical protein K2X62_03400 [Beijerinckiaceae bacterium]|nr:hypothetical protein [Beijerinckiaceae bacterium]
MQQRAMLMMTGLLWFGLSHAQAQALAPKDAGSAEMRAAPAQPAEVATPAYRSLPKPEMRRRLTRCATEWQKLKRDGKDAGLIWRDFAETCTSVP